MRPERARRRRRAIALTPLIDVIFILLLFFLLTSTFTRYGELPVTAASAGTGEDEAPPVFLGLGVETLALNGTPQSLEALAEALAGLRPDPEASLPVLVAIEPGVTSQRLIDLLSRLRPLDWASVTVLD
jgi:biopolymer transport protein ExbD